MDAPWGSLLTEGVTERVTFLCWKLVHKKLSMMDKLASLGIVGFVMMTVMGLY